MALDDTHHLLNLIYSKANLFHQYLGRLGVEHDFQFIPGNYLKIDDAYLLQEYPIPIMTIEKNGDIGYNLDAIFFEFFVDKATVLKLDLAFFRQQEVAFEVYGGTDCSVDFYCPEMSPFEFLRQIENAAEEKFGIAFYIPYSRFSEAQLFQCFREFQKKIAPALPEDHEPCG